MKLNVSWFRHLWRSQHGKCAISGIKLLGGPGLIGHGIGVDVIDPVVGIKKGNIRLVSAPMAISRLALPHTIYESPDYTNFPMSKVITKSLMPLLLASRILRRGPLQIKPQSFDNILTISLSLSWPTAGTVKGYRHAKTARPQNILEVFLDDDHLICKTLECIGYDTPTPYRNKIAGVPGWREVTLDINLNDPIDPVAPIVPLAEESFLVYVRQQLLAMTSGLLY